MFCKSNNTLFCHKQIECYEMIDLDNIDELGEYKGFVIIDPTDKQNIKGFFYIPKNIFDNLK